MSTGEIQITQKRLEEAEGVPWSIEVKSQKAGNQRFVTRIGDHTVVSPSIDMSRATSVVLEWDGAGRLSLSVDGRLAIWNRVGSPPICVKCGREIRGLVLSNTCALCRVSEAVDAIDGEG